MKKVITAYSELQSVSPLSYDMVMVIDPVNTPKDHQHMGTQAMYRWSAESNAWENIPEIRRYVARYPTEEQMIASLGKENYDRIVGGDYKLARQIDAKVRGYPTDEDGWDITPEEDIPELKWVDRRDLKPGDFGYLKS